MPAVNFSEELLIAYPNAKVILTTRDPDKWIVSVERSMYAIINSRTWSILKITLANDPMATQKIALPSMQD
ncbi:putative nad dependent epimerase dehydratase protein [Botrytis fragariae]|uniref:Putative nad dependent epimerase dehydratase protein n=1 Tax=Botrytis fragariae TaxID=1964551 RepID=A0A8H6EKN4_9HELO|nr:putative nad dependent epimerase dehydratase protein [Botrytis fragariae]KAF5875400.1 putative nad dependent epimerase dehydratase protein [Botrytis fragariae]